jgi:hypothetical protein
MSSSVTFSMLLELSVTVGTSGGYACFYFCRNDVRKLESLWLDFLIILASLPSV